MTNLNFRPLDFLYFLPFRACPRFRLFFHFEKPDTVLNLLIEHDDMAMISYTRRMVACWTESEAKQEAAMAVSIYIHRAK